MQEIYNKIIDLMKNNISDINDNYIQFSNPVYKPVNFDKNNFKKIRNIESENKIAFIDGGSAEIIKSSNFSLNLIRVYYTIYKKNTRITAKKHDFYVFVHAKEKDNEIFYDCDFIGGNEKLIPEEKDLFLSSLDETIKQGITRASISNVSNVIRRFSEIKTAATLTKLLEKDDIIVLDGSLQCTFTNEKKYFDELYQKAKENNITVSGLSKTTTLMTDKGNSISNALNKFNIDGKWIYHPVVDITSNNHEADMAFVKLHEQSKYIFRFEIYKEQKEKISQTIDLISNNCKDSVFIGYPYGLIEADRNARISNQEKQMMLTLFSTKLGKDWEKIKESLTSIDAHEILDNIG